MLIVLDSFSMKELSFLYRGVAQPGSAPRPSLQSSFSFTSFRMNILISNDDGYFSEGIQSLKRGLRELGHRVFLVAPDRDNSASGMSITVREPLTARKINDDEYALSGTPVDCVHIALGGLISEKIDLIVSGFMLLANY